MNLTCKTQTEREREEEDGQTEGGCVSRCFMIRVGFSHGVLVPTGSKFIYHERCF